MNETLQDLLDQDGPITQAQLTSEVIQRIREELSTLSETERETKLRELINKAQRDAQDEFNSLRTDVETEGPSSYSMEGVRELNDSEIFELFFERPEIMLIYRGWIAEKVSAYPYLAKHKTTIELTVWKHLVDQLSFGGIMSYAGGKITGFITGRVDSISEALSPGKEEALGGIDGLTTMLESVEGISSAFSNGEGEGEAVTGFIGNIQGFIEDVTQDYFTNLGQLDTLLKANGYIAEDGSILKPEVASIIGNPFAISALTKDGEYIEGNTRITLGENGTISVQALDDAQLEELQQSFMTKIGELTSNGGKRIDGLRNQTQKIAGLLSSLGFNSSSLTEFKDFLSDIPGVGGFLAAMLGFFLNDSVLSQLDRIGMNVDQKQALDTFTSFIQNSENSANLPFNLREENPGQLTGKETRIIRSLLNKIEGLVPGEGEERDNQVKALLRDPQIANKLLTGEGVSNDTILGKVHERIASLFSSGSKPSQDDFFEKIADESFNFSQDVQSDDEVTPPDEEVNDTVAIADFSEATSFPFSYQGNEVNYIPKTFELKVGENTFKISKIGEMEINESILNMAQPKISLSEQEMVFEYSLFGNTSSMNIEKKSFTSLLDQLATGEGGVLELPLGGDTIAIAFSKII